MPVERRAISLSEFTDLLGIDPPSRFLGLERTRAGLVLVLEPEDTTMQNTGTFPQIHSNTSRGGKSGSAKTPKGGGAKKV